MFIPPFLCPRNISIHPPRAGRDAQRVFRLRCLLHFNPPAPCGAGRVLLPDEGQVTVISIHPPRAGRDGDVDAKLVSQHDFNPPAPCGAGRASYPRTTGKLQISIHPPRAGRDASDTPRNRPLRYFNPPAPCGAGRFLRVLAADLILFQSTRPVRGGTGTGLDGG